MSAKRASALEALAARAGIEPEFKDALGRLKTTGVDTRRALLAAMGIAADDETQARAALEQFDRVEWERSLPPVCVLCRSAGAPAVGVRAAAGTKNLEFHIRLEHGRDLRSTVSFDSLELVERKEVAGTLREERRFVLPDDVPDGYHRLYIGGEEVSTSLIVSPGRCWLPPETAAGKRLWGVTVQMYLMRSATNWGIGDYADLARLAALFATRGGDVIGLNPLHAMFLDDPEHASPYSPASRLLLNVLCIDVASLAQGSRSADAKATIASAAFQADLARCRDAKLLDYAGVAALKLPVLRMIYAAWQSARESDEWLAFEEFRRAGGALLDRGTLFEALREHFAGLESGRGDWHRWPAAYRDPESAAVAAFAVEHASAISFHAWLQFIADAQLGVAAAAAESMAVGLYRDLAVGADPSGAETWCNGHAVVGAAQVGAPPDIYNPQGQNWGLPPFNPHALRREGYRSFIDLVRSNMRHAGGLRIDHVMALQHLYWVPTGMSPTEGAYVRYPLEDLVGILALESQRNRCLVVGEDLGTVPEGFREHMAAANILSYRVLFFEKDAAGFIAPHAYPKLALAVVGSHDLPTLRAWWQSSDLDLKVALQRFPTSEAEASAREERSHDREELIEALCQAGLPAKEGMSVDQLVRFAHAYLASSRAAFAMVQLDDITNEESPVNVPTTSTEHPNWRRRLSLTLEQVAIDARFEMLVGVFNEERARTP